MDFLDPNRVMVVSALHAQRTLPRLVTAVARCGFVVEDLRYHRSEDGQRALVTVVLDRHLASRDVQHLCKVVAGNVNVLWAQPLAVCCPDTSVRGPFRLDKYEVTTRRSHRWGGCEARVAAVVDGVRHLGASEAKDPLEALTGAFTSVLNRALNIQALQMKIADRWSYSPQTRGAVVVASAIGDGYMDQAVAFGLDEMDAAALALTDLSRAATATCISRAATAYAPIRYGEPATMA